MEFGCPEVGVFAPFLQNGAEDFALGLDHQLVEAGDGEFAACALFVELLLEAVADRDVEQENRTVADFLVQGAGCLRRAEGGGGENALGQDHLAEGRGRFGESHRIEVGEGADIAHDIAMEGVPDLVGEGADVAERVIIGHIDARLAGLERACAEGAGPFA